MTRYDFTVSLWVPEEWEHDGFDRQPSEVQRLLASMLRNAAARTAPTPDSLTEVQPAGYTTRQDRPMTSTPSPRPFDPGGELSPVTPAPEPEPAPLVPLSETTNLAPAPIEQPAGALEPHYEVSARFRPRGTEVSIEMRNQPKTKYARCGNCNARLALTDDPIENHHIAMRHKTTCGMQSAGQWPAEEFARQLEEFNRQPHVIQLKQQHAEDTERMKLERAAFAQLTAPAEEGKRRGFWARLWAFLTGRGRA